MLTAHVLFFAVVGTAFLSLGLLCTSSRTPWVRHSYLLPAVVYALYEVSLPKRTNIRLDLVILWPVVLFPVIMALMRR